MTVGRRMQLKGTASAKVLRQERALSEEGILFNKFREEAGTGLCEHVKAMAEAFFLV